VELPVPLHVMSSECVVYKYNLFAGCSLVLGTFRQYTFDWLQIDGCVNALNI